MTNHKNTPKELIFDDYFNSKLNKSLINNIKKHKTITFGYKFNQNINDLPNKIK